MPASDVYPVPATDVARWDATTDVLVVGAGCAGVCAALEAVRGGAETVLLEAAGGLGGVSAMSGGELYLGGGTALQKELGIEDSPEEMAKFLVAALGPHADEERIKVYSDGSPEHYDWLIEQGVPFKAGLWEQPGWVPSTDDGLMWLGENTYPYNELAVPAPRGHRPQAPGFCGALLMEQLVARVEESSIDVRINTKIQRLVIEADGQVVGAIAKQFGEVLAIRARRGVVLCTGGFIMNDQMLAAHAPYLLPHIRIGTPGDDGRGILIAQAAGAGVRNMSSAQCSVNVPIELLIRSVLINRFGQRFINEDTYGGLVGRAAIDGHHAPVYMVLDEAGFEAVSEAERLGRQPAWVSDDVGELEKEIGLPPGSLQATLAYYNLHAAAGDDPQFHKRAEWVRALVPPYGVIDVCAPETYPDGEGGFFTNTGFAGFTTGGLATTTDAQVLDLSGSPIPGLYAAGRTASGIHAGGYISGTSIGDGTFFGRRAGRHAAAAAAG